MRGLVGACMVAAATSVWAAAWPQPGADAAPLGLIEDPELECLALNVYFEARSEPLPGQFAIAHITLNRVADPQFPDTICGVVLQGGEQPEGRCQFSWWCDGQSDQVHNWHAWRLALNVARSALGRRAGDPTGGALFFHHVAVKPGWVRGRNLTARIGKHLFYR